MRFEAALAGMELNSTPGVSAGNDAWREAMRAKQEIGKR